MKHILSPHHLYTLPLVASPTYYIMCTHYQFLVDPNVMFYESLWHQKFPINNIARSQYYAAQQGVYWAVVSIFLATVCIKQRWFQWNILNILNSNYIGKTINLIFVSINLLNSKQTNISSPLIPQCSLMPNQPITGWDCVEIIHL